MTKIKKIAIIGTVAAAIGAVVAAFFTIKHRRAKAKRDKVRDRLSNLSEYYEKSEINPEMSEEITVKPWNDSFMITVRKEDAHGTGTTKVTYLTPEEEELFLNVVEDAVSYGISSSDMPDIIKGSKEWGYVTFKDGSKKYFSKDTGEGLFLRDRAWFYDLSVAR